MDGNAGFYSFFFFACSRFGQGHLVSGGFRPAAGRDCDDGMPASNVRPNEASAHMEQVLGNTVFQIPYSREVEEQVLQGNLFKELGLKESRGFRRAIEAVTGEVFGC